MRHLYSLVFSFVCSTTEDDHKESPIRKSEEVTEPIASLSIQPLAPAAINLTNAQVLENTETDNNRYRAQFVQNSLSNTFNLNSLF